MPPKTAAVQPKCAECESTESMLWRQLEAGQICQNCYEQKEKLLEIVEATKAAATEDNDTKDAADSTKSVSSADEKRLRKSTRAAAARCKAKTSTIATAGSSNGSNNNANSSKAQTKGRSRRNIFKKTPYKMPLVKSETHTVTSVFWKGSYIQVGDIVSLVDRSDAVYYAQIRGLLIDEYCEKSAFLTWLIPTQASPDPKDGFDAATYLIGHDEEFSRKLSCMEFVMHAPSNYYLDRSTPFPLPDAADVDAKPGGYIWSTLPEYKRRESVC